jgi:hypothetical protein
MKETFHAGISPHFVKSCQFIKNLITRLKSKGFSYTSEGKNTNGTHEQQKYCRNIPHTDYSLRSILVVVQLVQSCTKSAITSMERVSAAF